VVPYPSFDSLLFLSKERGLGSIFFPFHVTK
jgi:hypothetical protein